MYIYICIHEYIYICIYIYMYKYVCINIHVCIYMCVCLCLLNSYHIYLQVCIYYLFYARMYVYIYIYTTLKAYILCTRYVLECLVFLLIISPIVALHQESILGECAWTHPAHICNAANHMWRSWPHRCMNTESTWVGGKNNAHFVYQICPWMPCLPSYLPTYCSIASGKHLGRMRLDTSCPHM